MKNQIVNLLSQNIEVLTSEEISQLIEIPPKPEMGDFAFPCFRLAKSYHKAPPMIAQDLKESIGDQTFLSEIKVVGGYLNFYVDMHSRLSISITTQLIMAVLIRVRTRQSVSTTLHLTLLRISTLAI